MLSENQIREKRWFAEKDAEIENITTEDTFVLSADNVDISCIIARIHSKTSDNRRFVKRYFIPMIASSDNTQDAEHSPAFQKAILHQYAKSGVIRTTNGGKVSFHPFCILHFALRTVSPLRLRFPSSNVLTTISTDKQTLISKTYKDMRGYCGKDDRIWLPNPEPKRYEALAKSGYPNIPKVYGIACYHAANGEKTPLNFLMEAVRSKRQVGGVFADSLSRLTDDLGTIPPNEYLPTYHRHIKEILLFANDMAKSIARMHAAFLHSGMPGFQAVRASDEDIGGWSERVRNNWEHARAALNERSSKRPCDKILHELTKIELPPLSFPMERGIMKAQVHGDLHGDQGLIEDSVIRWLDFEGPPAKETVPNEYDSRENPLTDLAGMIQSFWYMLNAKLYELPGLNHTNPEDHEMQRKASLVLAGQLRAEEIPGLTDEFVRISNLWLDDVTTAFIVGYLDEVEKLDIRNAILAKWDRNHARYLTMQWVLARAVHELRYETYGRDWGWEGIPAGMIIKMRSEK